MIYCDGICGSGNACAALLSDNEKASSVIQDAVEESSGGDLITLAGYAANAGDGKLAASLISQIIAKFNRFAQFQELAEQITAAGNAAAAKIAFRSVERYLESVSDSVEFAKSMLSLFDNLQEAEKILDDAEFDCQFPSDFVEIATGIREILNDEEIVDELLDEAAASAMEGEEFLDAATPTGISNRTEIQRGNISNRRYPN